MAPEIEYRPFLIEQQETGRNVRREFNQWLEEAIKNGSVVLFQREEYTVIQHPDKEVTVKYPTFGMDSEVDGFGVSGNSGIIEELRSSIHGGVLVEK